MFNKDFKVREILTIPYKLEGLPFKDGGRGPNDFDCFGVVLEIFKRFGIILLDYGMGIASDDYKVIDEIIKKVNEDWVLIRKPTPGCLLVLEFPYPGWASHFGVMLDRQRFINIRRKTKVVVERVTSVVWKKRNPKFYIYKDGQI